MEYRNILSIPRNVRFGLEIELENIDKEKVYYLIRDKFGSTWKTKLDTSLDYNSTEIVSPILYNQKETWILLREMGNLIQNLKATFINCSFQVNFDDALLPTNKDKVKFLKLFAAYEDIIFRFSKGTDLYYRDSIDIYSSPLILVLKDMLQFDDEFIVEKFTEQKRYGIDFKTKKHKTIEFRTANGTNNPILWQNYITTFYYLLTFALNSKCNEKELTDYIRKYNKIYLLEIYEKLKLEKATELSKKIFKKSLDKNYFLEQYIGNDAPSL